jgi:hypothetical protein
MGEDEDFFPIDPNFFKEENGEDDGDELENPFYSPAPGEEEDWEED